MNWIENDETKNSYNAACIFVGGNVVLEQLPNNDRRDANTDRLMGEIYEVRR